MKRNITVIPFFGNWAIMLQGKEVPVSTHNLKSEAIKIATQLAKKSNSEIIVTNNEVKKKNRKLISA